ncbi:unnamed protein product [Amoebophrya sp. A25]|nr:unnamed protein product [Amoebophrya sp. A25]|eukprot:GSA25T00006771001.1
MNMFLFMLYLALPKFHDNEAYFWLFLYFLHQKRLLEKPAGLAQEGLAEKLRQRLTPTEVLTPTEDLHGAVLVQQESSAIGEKLWDSEKTMESDRRLLVGEKLVQGSSKSPSSPSTTPSTLSPVSSPASLPASLPGSPTSYLPDTLRLSLSSTLQCSSPSFRLSPRAASTALLSLSPSRSLPSSRTTTVTRTSPPPRESLISAGPGLPLEASTRSRSLSGEQDGMKNDVKNAVVELLLDQKWVVDLNKCCDMVAMGLFSSMEETTAPRRIFGLGMRYLFSVPAEYARRIFYSTLAFGFALKGDGRLKAPALDSSYNSYLSGGIPNDEKDRGAIFRRTIRLAASDWLSDEEQHVSILMGRIFFGTFAQLMPHDLTTHLILDKALRQGSYERVYVVATLALFNLLYDYFVSAENTEGGSSDALLMLFHDPWKKALQYVTIEEWVTAIESAWTQLGGESFGIELFRSPPLLAAVGGTNPYAADAATGIDLSRMQILYDVERGAREDETEEVSGLLSRSRFPKLLRSNGWNSFVNSIF